MLDDRKPWIGFGISFQSRVEYSKAEGGIPTESTIEKLKEKKLKVTPQRLAIYSILCRTNEHPNVENIYRLAEKTNPSISLATVYKTLDTLKTHGLLQELNIGEAGFRYDANTEPHLHLICKKCNRINDMFDIIGLDALRNEISEKAGFNINHEQLYYYGTCSDCGI